MLLKGQREPHQMFLKIKGAALFQASRLVTPLVLHTIPVIAQAVGWDLNERNVFLIVIAVSKVVCGCSQLPNLSAHCTLTVKKNGTEIFPAVHIYITITGNSLHVAFS